MDAAFLGNTSSGRQLALQHHTSFHLKPKITASHQTASGAYFCTLWRLLEGAAFLGNTSSGRQLALERHTSFHFKTK
ncbi:MAG: hypothetical protein EAY75_15090, partial [Bacteroidetes bacterium]